MNFHFKHNLITISLLALIPIYFGCAGSTINVRENKKIADELISHANSTSKVLPTNSKYIKFVLNLFDLFGKPLLFKEQYMIADRNIILDIKKAEKTLKWKPIFDDQNMINESYDSWLEQNK